MAAGLFRASAALIPRAGQAGLISPCQRIAVTTNGRLAHGSGGHDHW